MTSIFGHPVAFAIRWPIGRHLPHGWAIGTLFQQKYQDPRLFRLLLPESQNTDTGAVTQQTNHRGTNDFHFPWQQPNSGFCIGLIHLEFNLHPFMRVSQ